jgi:hypothetical protein
MSGTLNTKAISFVRRTLFLADPMEGRDTASLAVSELASEFCLDRECEYHDGSRACRKHAQATMLGVAKLLTAGEIFTEMSMRGVVFVRLTPNGVLAPSYWTTVPHWYYTKPDLVNWARTAEDRRRWEARV